MENMPGFKLAQINRVKLLPNTVKAWHIHYKQDDLWLPIPPSFLFVGLWDLRKDSKTKGNTMRISLAGGSSMLYIPKGVAHGMKNIMQEPIDILYFVDQKFDLNDPDERRVNWDALGADFWGPERD
jgi:dTDP-4-dehydrorhamnose 3,5-epimerase